MGVTYFLLLSCLGLAITVQAQECSKPVAGPNMNLKDEDILSETFQDGAKATFTCDVGYMSAGGSPVITCTAGNWSPVRLRCERKNCGSAGEVENGHIEYPEGTEFGDKLVISCNAGYTMVGKRQLTCEDLGWSGRLPVCEVVTCAPPPMIAKGTFSPNEETYKYSEVVQYSCQNAYTLNGSKSISCSADGTFKPAPPACIMVQCEDPNIEHADWVEGSRPPYRYKATVKYECRSGFTMIGAPTQICEKNSQWSPGLPKCERMTTTTKATTTTTTTTAAKKPATTGSSDTTGDEGQNNGETHSPLTVGLIVCGSVLGIGGAGAGAVYAKKKQSSGKDNPENGTTKDEEQMALSGQHCSSVGAASVDVKTTG